MAKSTVKSTVIDVLYQIADLLEQQQANPFRVNAFRKAARTLAETDVDLEKLIESKGSHGLEDLPDIGPGISKVIYEIVATGTSSRLSNLRGALDPEHLFQTVPGIGAELARHIHEALHVDTLEALEIAAHDGRLETVEGVGPRRAAAFRAALGNMLGRGRRREPSRDSDLAVAMILDVDAEYRKKAQAGELPLIAPKRFNPDNKAWLPVLHTKRDGWHFTALYSNTARAHKLGKSRDWVVIYYYDDDHHEYQHTVVTEVQGPLAGSRVVRGREEECREHYMNYARTA